MLRINLSLESEEIFQMKKLSVLLLIALSSTMLLFGCGKDSGKNADSDKEINGADIGLPGADDSEAEEPVADETEDADVPDGSVKSQLTNELVSQEVADTRPISVMMPNDTSALPHYSISNAGVLYQIMVEGNITRLMAIIEDWQDLERIGNVRSARDYYVFAAYEWDVLFCHYGNPFYADDVLARDVTNNINGMVAPSGVFYRTKDRKAPQNAYLSGKGILDAVDYYKYDLEHTENFEPGHFTFANDGNDLSDGPDAFDATYIDMSSAYPVDKTYFKYDDSKEVYERFQYGKPHVDEATGEQLAFANVIVQNTYSEDRDAKGYKAFQMHDDTKDGYFFTAGKGIHVTWEKKGDFDATKYYDDDGNEIELNTGKTMICVVQDGRDISWD